MDAKCHQWKIRPRLCVGFFSCVCLFGFCLFWFGGFFLFLMCVWPKAEAFPFSVAVFLLSNI